MYKFKKLISTVLAVAMLATVSTSVFAEDGIQKREVTVTENNLVSFFDPYVEPDGRGFLSLNVPSNIEIDIEPALYQQVLDALEITNSKIANETLELMPNGTLVDPNAVINNEISSRGSGQVNKTTQMWWGYEMWMSYDVAEDWTFEYDQAIIAYAATIAVGTGGLVFIPVVGSLGAFAFAATSAVPLTTMKLVSNKAHHLLDTSDRGIVVNQWNTIIGTTVNPQ